MREYPAPDLTAFRVLCENGPSDVNVRDFILNSPNVPPARIVTTFCKTTPESVEQGDYSESGYEDEEGVIMEPDEIEKEDGITVADKAVDWLRDKGATEASSSDFHVGLWYSTDWHDTDYRTGEQTEYSYHLKGFTEQEEREVYDLMRRQRRR